MSGQLSKGCSIKNPFSSQSSDDGHLDCFHVLAILNIAAMNIGMHVPNFVYSSIDGHLSGFHFLAIVNNAAMKEAEGAS